MHGIAEKLNKSQKSCTKLTLAHFIVSVNCLRSFSFAKLKEKKMQEKQDSERIRNRMINPVVVYLLFKKFLQNILTY